MASSRNSSRDRPPAGDLAARVAAKIKENVRPAGRLVVGFSGGVDSVALLDCLHRCARKQRIRLSALHINHQLSPNAARWSAFCRRLCRARDIAFESVKVDVARDANVEASARAARHAVFSRQRCDFVVLAHHLDDQVETLVLQLLRGAGVKGLAAMPLLREAQGERHKAQGTSSEFGLGPSPITHHPSPSILRPLLDVTRKDIIEYAKKRGLKWVEDESNRALRFRRNFLRHKVLPLIERRFPAYRTTIARAARHLAEAAGLLDEVAAADGAGQIGEGSLGVETLRRLPRARARNLLRYFLDSHGLSMPGAERLDEALRQVLAAKQDARVAIGLEGADLRRFNGRIYVVQTLEMPRQFRRRWRGERRLDLPELRGMLTLERTTGGGISIARLARATVTVRLRQGGERLRPDRRRPRRSLKNLLQEAQVAPWLRERLPLIFHAETLVWAPGIGVDCGYQARRGEPALTPRWLPSQPVGTVFTDGGVSRKP